MQPFHILPRQRRADTDFDFTRGAGGFLKHGGILRRAWSGGIEVCRYLGEYAFEFEHFNALAQ